jgi:hypothetical protein
MAVRSLANESPEYQKLRAELLQAELALCDQIERVAALHETFQGLGYGEIGIARSRDLVHGRVAGDLRD